jgi:hypothetical protein
MIRFLFLFFLSFVQWLSPEDSNAQFKLILCTLIVDWCINYQILSFVSGFSGTSRKIDNNLNMSKIGINGFGRIGRLVLRASIEKGAEVSWRVNFIFS